MLTADLHSMCCMIDTEIPDLLCHRCCIIQPDIFALFSILLKRNLHQITALQLSCDKFLSMPALDPCCMIIAERIALLYRTVPEGDIAAFLIHFFYHRRIQTVCQICISIIRTDSLRCHLLCCSCLRSCISTAAKQEKQQDTCCFLYFFHRLFLLHSDTVYIPCHAQLHTTHFSVCVCAITV